MSHVAVTLEDFLADYEASAARWKGFFDANPDAALVATDIAGSKNVGELVWHIYAASFRTAQRLLGEEISDMGSLFPVRNVSTAFELQTEGMKKLKQFLETASEATLEEEFEIRQSGGKLLVSGTKRKLCLQSCMRSGTGRRSFQFCACRAFARIGGRIFCSARRSARRKLLPP